MESNTHARLTRAHRRALDCESSASSCCRRDALRRSTHDVVRTRESSARPYVATVVSTFLCLFLYPCLFLCLLRISTTCFYGANRFVKVTSLIWTSSFFDRRILFLKVTPKKVSQRGPRGDNIFKQQILSSDNFKSLFSILEFVRSDLQNLIMPFLNLNWTIR